MSNNRNLNCRHGVPLDKKCFSCIKEESTFVPLRDGQLWCEHHDEAITQISLTGRLACDSGAGGAWAHCHLSFRRAKQIAES